jgi:hypothetical protein
MKIYLAGKVTKNGWRESILEHRARLGVGSVFRSRDALGGCVWPVLANAVLGEHDYTGPYTISCGHGCAHGDDTHGVAGGEEDYLGRESHDTQSCIDVDWTRGNIFEACISAIRRSDLVFAWLDDPSAHGTLVEIGYARGAGVPVAIGIPDSGAPDLWFAERCDTALGRTVRAPSADEALRRVLQAQHLPGLVARYRHRKLRAQARRLIEEAESRGVAISIVDGEPALSLRPGEYDEDLVEWLGECRTQVATLLLERRLDRAPAATLAAPAPPGSVYFIQAGGGDIKIGFSDNPAKRLAQLQTGQPQRLRLLATIPGDARREREIHARFARHRRQGEWFAPAPEILRFIADQITAGVRP